VADYVYSPEDCMAATRRLADDAIRPVDSYDSKQFGGHLVHRVILARSDSFVELARFPQGRASFV